MITNLSVGDVIPLQFQLFDYLTSKYVQVFLTDENNVAIDTVQLTAGQLGLYTDNSQTMPDTKFVVAQYVVYDDASYTTVSTSEGGGSDVFILDSLTSGSGIPLYLQLFDYDASKFVKVFVSDDSGNPLDGSPVELTPLGSLGLYGDSSIVVPSSVPFAVAQYVVYDNAGYSVVSTSEGGSSDTFFFSIIALAMNAGNLPNMSDALLDYFQPMVFTILTKTISKFKVSEQPNNKNFYGVWQPLSPQQLVMKPHGQRSWRWFSLHSDPTLSLKPDDIVKYEGIPYRVMGKFDYTRYKYMQYELVEDYAA